MIKPGEDANLHGHIFLPTAMCLSPRLYLVQTGLLLLQKQDLIYYHRRNSYLSFPHMWNYSRNAAAKHLQYVNLTRKCSQRADRTDQPAAAAKIFGQVVTMVLTSH